MEARIVDVASPARRFAHGQALVRQGQVPDCLFLVRAGLVRLAAALASGHEVVVGLLGPGDVFGECSLLGDPSPVEARAVGPVQVEAVPLTALQAVLERSPGTATELLRLLASRLHRTTGA
ncbi:MAG TPA: Crp/Fnr family transcriptional regulator, partial [Actinomycetota bacterium]